MADGISRPFHGSRHLDTLGYLLVWTGALGLLLVPDAPPQLILVFCLVIAPSRFLSPATHGSVAYRTVWRLITVAFIVLSLLDWYWSGRPLRQTLVAQMLFFQIYKAYNSKGYWDYLEMALFTALMIVFSGLVTRSVFFLAVLVPFVGILVGFLRTLNLSRQYLSWRPGRAVRAALAKGGSVGYQVTIEKLDPRGLTAPAISWSLQTVAVLVVGIALFYFLPRERGFSPSHLTSDVTMRGRDIVVSGLSMGVNLRLLSAIKLDPRPVLRVTFPTRVPSPDTIYLRSGALERFSRLEWSPVQSPPRVGKPDADGTYWFQRVDVAERPLLIPHIVEFLDAPGQAPIALPGLVALDQVTLSPNERKIAVVGRLTSLRRYRAFSWGLTTSRQASSVSEDEYVLSEALKLPEDLSSLDIYQMATRITHRHADNLERAQAIEQYLRRRYGYTLNIEPLNGPADGPNPIEQFLFKHPQGNCEVFASAMVVLCRNLQIPSRLVIGYHGGIQGDSPKEIVFRNQDAHAWVEVWSPQRGWATFDPTPPVPLEVYSGRFSFKKLLECFGSATGQWNRLIVWYDRDAKEGWMASLWDPIERWLIKSHPNQALLDRLAPRLRENIARPQIIALLTGLVGLNIAVAVLYGQARRRWRESPRRAAGRHRTDPWLHFYRSAVAVLRGKLARRLPAQTPGEFLEALAHARSLDPMILGPIVDLYHHGRFGDMPWNPEVARESDQLLRRLTEVIRNR